MNSEDSKTSDHNSLLPMSTNKINVRRSNKYDAV